MRLVPPIALLLLFAACAAPVAGTGSRRSNTDDNNDEDTPPSTTPPANPTPVTTGNTLTVTITGVGSVSSSPAGIACSVIAAGAVPTGTCSAPFTAGASVILTASPATATFTGCTAGAPGSCTAAVTGAVAVGASFGAGGTPDGTWTGSYTHNEGPPVVGCQFNNTGTITTTIAAGVSTTTTAQGFQLKDGGCNLVSVQPGTAAAAPLATVGTQITGTWNFNITGANNNPLPLPFTATINGKTMTGSWTCTGCTGSFTMTKP